jgi:hypothetical protein
MTEFDVPSKSLSSRGFTELVGKLCCWTNLESTKQCVDPESTRAGMRKEESEMKEVERSKRNELGSERADALSLTVSVDAQEGATQSSACAEH